MAVVNLEDYVIDQVGNVKVLDGWRLLELDEAAIYGPNDPFGDEGIATFRTWCDFKGVTYYARPRGTFLKAEAYDIAESDGNTYLIMEDLS